MLYISLVIGSLLGFLYALFFIYERKRTILALRNDDSCTKMSCVGRNMLHSIVRLLFLLLTFFFVLKTLRVNVMLMLFSFLTTFWLVIIRRESEKHGRR